MAVSTHSWPRSAAMSRDSRPRYAGARLSQPGRTTPSGPALAPRFSQSVGGFDHLCRMRARAPGSRRLSQSLPSASAQGGRHEARPVPAAIVGVHVGGDVEALGAGGVDAPDDLGHLVPVWAPGRLQVVDLRRHAGAPGDLDRLVEPFQQAGFLGAQVGDVDAAVLRNDLAERDQLVGSGVAPGRVDQGGGDAEGAVLHRLGQHARSSRRARRPSASPMASPLPHSRTVPPPTNEPTLTETPRSSSQRSQSPKRVHELDQLAPDGVIAGDATTRISRNGSSMRPPNGAGVQASPMISVVTPCVILERERRSLRERDDRVRLDVDEAGADDHPGRVDDLARPVERRFRRGRSPRSCHRASTTSP